LESIQYISALYKFASEGISGLLNIVFPPRCAVCSDYTTGRKSCNINWLCDKCIEDVNFISSPLCSICGIPFPKGSRGEDHPCGNCIENPPPFDKAISVFVYDGSIIKAIYSFKYGDKSYLFRAFGELLAEKVKNYIDYHNHNPLIVPVPLCNKRLRHRGYNQSALLAGYLAKKLNLVIDYDSLIRIRDTVPQVDLKKEERRKNLINAFTVNNPNKIKNREIILVDDVYTTGSTLKECSKTLKKAGALKVDCVTIARVEK
jgi:ComF family protein